MSGTGITYVPPPPSIPSSEFIIANAIAFFIFSMTLILSAYLLVRLITGDRECEVRENEEEEGERDRT